MLMTKNVNEPEEYVFTAVLNDGHITEIDANIIRVKSQLHGLKTLPVFFCSTMSLISNKYLFLQLLFLLF